MPAAVAISVITIMRAMPRRSASTPQASLPTMPPASTSGTAATAQPAESPFAISRKAMNVRKALRVLESRTSIRQSARKRGRSRIPHPFAPSAGAWSLGTDVRVFAVSSDSTAIAVTIATAPKPSTGTFHETPATSSSETVPPNANLPTSPAKL